MTRLDVPWALGELRAFLHSSDQVAHQNAPGDSVVVIGTYQRESDDLVARRAQVVEQILDRVLPDWRGNERRTSDRRRERWAFLREQASRATAELERAEELRARLGDDAPQLDAGQMHPWVWDGARSLWQSGHYGEAVTAAAKKLNAETQNKVGRRDLGETKLFQETFSLNPAEPGKARLRLGVPDGSPGYRDRQSGAIQLAGALYTGLRNPASHEMVDELLEDEALEQLAAFSVLARIVDRAEVETA